MNRNFLARASLAALIALVLIVPAILGRAATQSAPRAAALAPVQHLPIAIRCGYYPDPQTCPSATPTTTATATATTTTTATTTATVTPSPTFDPTLTAQLTIVNSTGAELTFTLAGPSNATGSVAANLSKTLQIKPGHYTLTTMSRCRTDIFEFDMIANQGRSITATCN
jgi:hypothetical protein